MFKSFKKLILKLVRIKQLLWLDPAGAESLQSFNWLKDSTILTLEQCAMEIKTLRISMPTVIKLIWPLSSKNQFYFLELSKKILYMVLKPSRLTQIWTSAASKLMLLISSRMKRRSQKDMRRLLVKEVSSFQEARNKELRSQELSLENQKSFFSMRPHPLSMLTQNFKYRKPLMTYWKTHY